ncbi:MAG: CARDB domain-containing protein, partial [Planctomycetota bacterium]
MIRAHGVRLSVVFAGALAFLAGCGGGGPVAPPAGPGNVPNLAVDSVSFATPTVQEAQNITLSYRLRNTGGADADAFTVEFYLSDDGSLDTATDELVGTLVFGGGLEEGASETNQQVLAAAGIPTVAGETWYAFIVVDTAEVVDETSEYDNVASSGLLTVVAAAGVDPDLTGAITDFAAPIYETDTIDVGVSVTNEGGAPAVASLGVLYLSTTTSIADNVATSTGVAVPALSPGETHEDVESLTVPDAVAGDLYLIWVVDRTGLVTEDNAAGTAETNNQSNVAVAVVDDAARPDLQATGTTTDLPATLPEGLAYPVVRRGDTRTITSSFEEVGAGDVLSDFDAAVWLSADETIGVGGDSLLATATHPGGLLAGGAATVDMVLTVPDSALTGHGYVGCEVDVDDEVAEVNEADVQNIDQYGEGEVLEFDLLDRGFGKGEYDVSVVDASINLLAGEVVAGGSFACRVNLDSEGDVPSSVTLSVYRSSNPTITALDDLVGSAVVDPSDLMFGSPTVICTAPAYVTPVVGDENDYYWGVIISAAADAVEENNTWEAGWQFTVVQALSRDVDLTADSVLVAILGVIELDEPFLIGYQVGVDGNDDTGPFFIDFYASSDTTIDASDVLIATVYNPGLPAGYDTPGAPLVEEVLATLDTAAAVAGNIDPLDSIYIGMIVDADDDIPVAEGDIVADNDAVSPSTYWVVSSGGGAPELSVVAYFGPSGPPMDPPTFYVREGSTGIQWPLVLPVNMGTQGVVGAEVGIYLSDDQIVDVNPSTGDILLDTIYVTLGAGEYRYLTDAGSLDFTGIPPGDYWAYAYIDPLDAVTELDDTNNDSTSVFWGPDDYGSWVPVTVYAGAPTTKPDLIGDLDFEITSAAALPADVQGDLWAIVSNSMQDVAGLSVMTTWGSEDANAAIGPTDFYAGQYAIGTFQPGELEEQWLADHNDINVAGYSIEAGKTYTVKLAVDAAEEEDESDENNIAVFNILDCLVVEPFDTGEPGTWTVVDGGETGGTAGYETWTDEGLDYMIVDSATYGGDLDMDEELITPVLDCTGLRTVLLSFDHEFLFADVGETGEIEISLDGGTTWEPTPLASYASDVSEVTTIDITAAAAGEPAVAIRWHYTTTLTAGYWGIDDVQVLGYGFGTAPDIVSATDDDDAGGAFGLGDTITFVFNKATNESVAVSSATTGTDLDLLFAVSGGHTFGNYGAGYTAVWHDARTLVITVTADNGSANVAVGDTFAILTDADIQDANEWSGPSVESSPALEGDWGKPMIVSIVADDPDDSEGTFDIGDRIVITFDAPTNMPFSASTPGTELDTYFLVDSGAGTFGTSNYNVSWSGTFDVMTISVLNGAGASIYIDNPIQILPAANIQDPNESSGATTDSGILGGDWGKPRLVGITADGDLGSRGTLDAGDVITITFDADTNESRAATDMPGAMMDGFFRDLSGGTFATGLYDIVYPTPNVLEIRVKDGTGADVKVGDAIAIDATVGIQDPNDSSGVVTESGTLTGHLGIPIILTAIADDPDDLGGAFGDGDTITITFDAPTNEWIAGTATGATLNGWLTLSNGHTFGDGGIGYNLSWPDPSTLVISVAADNGSATVAVGDTITVDVSANIRDFYGLSGATTASQDLTGDWGKPLVVSITADGSAGNAGYLDAGDIITITFDAPTNERLDGITLPGDSMAVCFDISGGPGTFGDTGNWFTWTWPAPDELVILVEQLSGVMPADIVVGATFEILPAANIQDVNSSSGATTDSGVLGGHFGIPMILDVSGDGDAGSAGYLDAGDVIWIHFDALTNESLDGLVLNGTEMDVVLSYESQLVPSDALPGVDAVPTAALRPGAGVGPCPAPAGR